MADRDLELNTLSRYAKNSPHLVREEFGHCEIPAGCGGVVLRWRNPDDGVPVPVRLHTAGECRTYLDGDLLTEGRPLIPFGEHQLAFEITGADPRYVVLLFAAVYREEEQDGIRRSRRTGHEVAVLSAADGTWKFTTEPPADPSWLRPEYDDAAWTALVRNEERPSLPEGQRYDPARWRIQSLEKLGAEPLGPSAASPGVWKRISSLIGVGAAPPGCVDLWIRKRFTLVPTGGRADG